MEVLLGRRLLGNALTVFLPTALLTVIGKSNPLLNFLRIKLEIFLEMKHSAKT